MESVLTETQVLDRLRAVVTEAGSQNKAAAALGVSKTLMSFVLTGKMAPPPSMLAPLGIRKVTRYIEEAS